MQVREIMTGGPAVCTPATPLRDVARMMVEHDCGCIPVVEDHKGRRPVGVVTDRDITCRMVAEGKNPLEATAQDCMSTPCVTASEDESVEDCCRKMEENQVRRIPVVDKAGGCCGVVAQADVALEASAGAAAGVVKDVSRPNDGASAVSGARAQGHGGCCG